MLTVDFFQIFGSVAKGNTTSFYFRPDIHTGTVYTYQSGLGELICILIFYFTKGTTL